MADAIPVPVEEYDAWKRFMAKVDQHGPIPEVAPHLGPCWLWTAAKFAQGYGMFVLNGKRRRAHRVLYVWEHGEPGQPLDHLCRNRACVNPSHLEPKTAGENVLAGEGPTAENARKETCVNGHPFDGVNSRGERTCSICQRAATDRYQDKNRDELNRRKRERRAKAEHPERECAMPSCDNRFTPLRSTGVYCRDEECVQERARLRNLARSAR